ncbi:MAG: serine/threonine-protein kinase [Aquabacterium sp.]|uniref:serine/threonine protein kinase n=1 Tax=Aquabacterium sp. TaxID=1872578 RepID=UPI0027177453|nr:serine/threonine-protein kinase [Aquabacterium sp.]MDO9004561.1 serine/threonine-protein kinase [Aquabacterium sp.]
MPPVAEHDALPTGTRLGEFEIERVLGVGGFGIVYLAFDHALERQVAIKEYMPVALAARGQGLGVSLRAASHAETFALGLRSFINEARLLARFDHPALVKVYRFWEEHGTAYMVMPYYRGQTVQNARREMTVPPDETWLRQVIEPVLGALDCLHREQVFHRDIAPDNILLLDDVEEGEGPRPVLLDLGAARHVIGDHTQSLTAILKPSFAPIEQYAETVQLRQGAWTDLYALAAVVHFCITGRPPTPASARAVHDDLPGLTQMSEGLASGFDRHYSSSFANAIDHALAVRPQDRPDSVAAWRQELSGIVNVGQQGLIQGDGWVPRTVLVRPADGQKPAGHEAVEARAYLTTIPAAGALRALPKWPITVAKGKKPVLPPASEPTSVKVESILNRRWVMGMAFVVVVAASGLWAQRQSTRSQPQDMLTGAAAAASVVSAKASAASGKSAPAKAVKGEPGLEDDQTARTRKRAGSNVGDVAEPLNPRQACGSRTFISLAICMKRHCSRPAYAGHAECKRMTEQEQGQRSAFP